jgi:hypothetical protein
MLIQVKMLQIETKLDFIKYTILNLGFQVFITLITSVKNKDTKVNNKWVLLLASFGLLLIISLIKGLPFFVRFGLLITFSYINGLVLSGIVKHIPKEEVNRIIQQTFVMFVSLFMVGWYMHYKGVKDVSALNYAITSLSFVSIGLVLYHMFVDTSRNVRKLTRTVLIIISSLYIVYDTYYNFSNEISDDIVTSTLNYYLDVYNIMSSLFSEVIENELL